MNKDERRWHWVYTGEEFQFAEDIPFASVRYNHSWKRPEELPMHRHKFTESVLILRGHASHIIHLYPTGTHVSQVRRGDVLIINPHEEHTFELAQGEELELININFTSEFLDGFFKQGDAEVRILDFVYQQPMLPPDIRFSNKLRLGEEEIEEVVALVARINREMKAGRVGYRMMMGYIMAQILMIISRRYLESLDSEENEMTAEIKDFSYISRVKGYIEYHYAEDIKKEELARIGMCSERQLSRKFKQQMGMTVTAYINEVRLNHARELLLRTDEKITKIALKAGFNDISYFNRTFAAAVGMTPREYRSQGSGRGGPEGTPAEPSTQERAV